MMAPATPGFAALAIAIRLRMSAPRTCSAPAKLGPITLRNRIIKSATFEARTPDALVTDDLIEYHRLPAAGGVGMTTVAYLRRLPRRPHRGQRRSGCARRRCPGCAG